jgi:hypothetical protein
VPVSVLNTPRIGPPTYSTSLWQNRQTDPGNIKISHRYMSVGTGRQNILILFLEITVSFLGIHKWEPDISIGFLPALYLQRVRVYVIFIDI